jgi:hypothetical protein
MSLKVPCDVKSPQTTFATGNIRAGSRKTLEFLQQTITMNENAQWQMIKDSVFFVLSSGFSVSLLHFYLKKNRLEVYCSMSLKVPCDVKSPQTTFATGNI